MSSEGSRQNRSGHHDTIDGGIDGGIVQALRAVDQAAHQSYSADRVGASMKSTLAECRTGNVMALSDAEYIWIMILVCSVTLFISQRPRTRTVRILRIAERTRKTGKPCRAIAEACITARHSGISPYAGGSRPGALFCTPSSVHVINSLVFQLRTLLLPKG